MLPLIRVSETGERIGEPSYPPALTLKLTIREPRQNLQMFHSVLGAERIRDYLAYATGARIPIRWVMASKRFLFPQEFIFDGQAYMPPELLIGRKDYSEWAREIESGMVEGQRLLEVPEAGSPLDRAIDLVGRAITTDDRESCFLYCWRAIETVSAMDLEVSREAFKAGDVRAGRSVRQFPTPSVLEGRGGNPARHRPSLLRQPPEKSFRLRHHEGPRVVQVAWEGRPRGSLGRGLPRRALWRP